MVNVDEEIPGILEFLQNILHTGQLRFRGSRPYPASVPIWWQWPPERVLAWNNPSNFGQEGISHNDLLASDRKFMSVERLVVRGMTSPEKDARRMVFKGTESVKVFESWLVDKSIMAISIRYSAVFTQ